MPKPIKSQEAHDSRFNADKENFRQKYGSMSLEEIAECGKVRGCTAEYRKEYAKGGLKTHKELYKIKNGGESLEEIATSSKRILSRDKWGRKDEQARSQHWRPFKDYDEFIETVGRDLGDSFGMRRKNLPTGIVHIVLVTEFHQELNTIGLGTCTYSYKELYDNYEWYDEKTEKWMPFGVEE